MPELAPTHIAFVVYFLASTNTNAILFSNKPPFGFVSVLVENERSEEEKDQYFRHEYVPAHNKNPNSVFSSTASTMECVSASSSSFCC